MTLKSKVKRQDWRLANSKREEGCRIARRNEGRKNIIEGPCDGPVELAHSIGKAVQDVEQENGTYLVLRDAVIPLCKKHHMAYDANQLDLLPYLTKDEEHSALDACPSIWMTVVKLSGGSV